MKVFSIIWIFIILSGYLSPCDDGSDKENIKTEIVNNSSHQQQDDSDDCSPFCSCSCCVGFTKPVEHLVDFKLSKTPNSKSIYLEKYYFTIKIPLYLPPKFS